MVNLTNAWNWSILFDETITKTKEIKADIIEETEIKQIMSENPTWKFEYYHATH